MGDFQKVQDDIRFWSYMCTIIAIYIDEGSEEGNSKLENICIWTSNAGVS